MNADDRHGIVGDVLVIEGKAGGSDEFSIAVVGVVLDGLTVRIAIRSETWPSPWRKLQWQRRWRLQPFQHQV